MTIFTYALKVAPNSEPKVISLPGPAHSVLGQLRVVEPEKMFGFVARRSYWIEGVPGTAIRGHHAHRNLHQAIILLRGHAVIKLITPEKNYTFDLGGPEQALIVPPGFWREMSSFSSDALMMVYASELYDEADYIRDWDSYVEFFQSR